MPAPSNLDPFNLAKLSDTIDKKVLRVLTKDFHSVVSENALKSVKSKLKGEINTIMVEMMNDISHLGSNPQVGPMFSANERILTVAQMAEALPKVYAPASQTGDAESDRNAEIQRCIKKVKWIFNSWLQIYGQLIHRISDESSVAVEGVFAFEGVEEPFRVPTPSEIDTVAAFWQIVRRLTLEYLQAKAELLIALGEDVPRVAIDYDDDNQELIELRKAFWSNNPATGLLMLQALRSALLRTLQLYKRNLPLDLRLLSTSQVLLLAHNAGLQLPFPLDLLGNMAFDLEGRAARCQVLEVSNLYPYFRIFEDTIQHLLALPPDADVHKRTMNVLQWNAEALHYANQPSPDNQRCRCY